MDENTTVDTNMVEESVQDDAVLASATDNEQSGVMAISALLNGESTEESTEGAAEETQDVEPQHMQQSEPKVNGGIKGRLLAEHNKGYQAGMSEAQKQFEAKEAEYKAEIERLKSYEIRERAAKIAQEQNVSADVAEFLAKHGFGADTESHQSQPEKPNTPMRDAATGRFVSQKTEAADSGNELATKLWEQAQNIKRMSGVDALALFSSADAETMSMIQSGKMDFYDLVRTSNAAESKPAARRAPPNIKTNSTGANGRLATNFSDDDIDRLNEYMRNGGVIDTRK